jgi:hypothetical protein
MSTEERLAILREAKPNTWIVFSADEEHVIARGTTFAEAAAEAEKSEEKDPLFTLVPPSWAPTLL